MALCACRRRQDHFALQLTVSPSLAKLHGCAHRVMRMRTRVGVGGHGGVQAYLEMF